MLTNILPDITRLCRIMATVTGVDIEIVDTGMIRVAGTGVYADGVGRSIGEADNIYREAFSSGKTVYVDDPRENAICRSCSDKHNCRELLNLCTPIVLEGKILGIIGVICFTEEEKRRVQEQSRVFAEFVEQIATVISSRADQERHARRVNQMLDTLLQVTDGNSRGILMMSRQGTLSYVNNVARSEFALAEDCLGTTVRLRDTGNIVADMQEYEVRVGGTEHLVFGRFLMLESEDEAFSSVLLIDPLPRLTEMLAHSGASAESPGGLDAIVGESRVLAKLKKRVRQIARTDSTVLITGESGTGKEMFARAIHAESERKDKPFIAINCGAIPDELLESELFGYVRGAFTGADQSGRMGKFELASNGVIFLDEISSMSLYLQVKLLRVLQEKSFVRLGSNRLIHVDVRVIAATNDDLAAMIEQRMFRDDLFYRLNVIPLDLPPLRKRKEDIPRLAEYFLDRYCRRFSKPPARLSPRILEIFQAYSWPGNIREFENCIEYMVNMHEGGVMHPALVPLKIRNAFEGERALVALPAESDSHAGTALSGDAVPVDAPSQPIVPLADLEAEAIKNAVARFGTTAEGKKRAAKALGIGVATLYRKLQQIQDE